jgi:hypothetical protein
MTCVVGNTSMAVTLVRLTCSLQIHRYVHGVLFHFAMDAPSWTVGFFFKVHEKVIAHPCQPLNYSLAGFSYFYSESNFSEKPQVLNFQ